jgi:hypothetical protein
MVATDLKEVISAADERGDSPGSRSHHRIRRR